jgi:S1-C subfamily serine protease
MYLRILVFCVWILSLTLPATAQTGRRKPRSAKPAAPVAEPSQKEPALTNKIVLRQNQPKGWVWVSQRIDQAKQLGGVENIMTLDGEPPPPMMKKRVTLGLVIDDEGHIVTRLFDVSPTSPPIDAKAYATATRSFPLSFVGMDAVTGLCVLKAENAPFQPASIASQSTLPAQKSLRLYGFHPNLNQNTIPGLSMDRPRLNEFNAQITKATNDFRYSASNPIYYLQSPKMTSVQDCSLLLEKYDSVFGMAIYDIGSGTEHLVYPISRIRTIAEKVIKTHKSLAYGWLGFTGMTVAPTIQTPISPQKSAEPGVRITTVAPDSPADVAGLLPKDILLSLNERRIESSEQLATAMQQIPSDCELTLKIKRGSEYKTLKAKLIPAPATEPEQQLIAFVGMHAEMEEELKMLPPSDPSRQRKIERAGMMEDFLNQVRSAAPADVRLRVLYGFEIQPLTAQLRTFFAVTNGVLVWNLNENNKASRAGLQAGDVITSVGAAPVTDLVTLLTALDNTSSDKIEVTVQRKRESIKLYLTR